MNQEAKENLIRLALFLTVCLAAFFVGGAMHSTSQVHWTEHRTTFGGQAQESIPDNATVYGQANMTAHEYMLFRKEILGHTYEFRRDGSKKEPRDYLNKQLQSSFETTLDYSHSEEQSLQTMVNRSFHADYLQADGHYYPVTTSITSHSETSQLGNLHLVMLPLLVLLFISFYIIEKIPLDWLFSEG